MHSHTMDVRAPTLCDFDHCILCHPIKLTLCRLTTEYSLNASVQASVDDVSRVDKKVGCHSKVCGIDAASIFSLYFFAHGDFLYNTAHSDFLYKPL